MWSLLGVWLVLLSVVTVRFTSRNGSFLSVLLSMFNCWVLPFCWGIPKAFTSMNTRFESVLKKMNPRGLAQDLVMSLGQTIGEEIHSIAGLRLRVPEIPVEF